MAFNSSILAWKIPLTEKPGNSTWGCKESDFTEWTRLFLLWMYFFTYLLTEFGHPLVIYHCYTLLQHINILAIVRTEVFGTM